METTIVAAFTPAGHPLVALTSTALILEVVILVIILAILATVLVLNQRRKRPAKPAQAVTGQHLYAELQEPAAAPQAGGFSPVGPVGQADPFAGFATASPAQAAPSVPMPPAAPPSVGAPPPGTPAGWLPDPSGAPSTLRYWDGAAWTQHVAQPS